MTLLRVKGLGLSGLRVQGLGFWGVNLVSNTATLGLFFQPASRDDSCQQPRPRALQVRGLYRVIGVM